jgi:fimbrial chaperone protein
MPKQVVLLARLVSGISCALFASFVYLDAQAANLSVYPLRGELNTGKTSEVFTIRNQSSEPVVVQASVSRWSQKEGQDVLDATRDILVAPAVIEIPANESQIVRVAVRKAADPSREESFRLLIQEVPRPKQANGSQVVVALSISLPIFYVATPGSLTGSLDVTSALATSSLDKNVTKNTLTLVVSNPGAAHVQVTSTQASDGQGALGKFGSMFYVLPGVTRKLGMAIDRPAATGKAVKVDLVTTKGTITKEVMVP